MKTIIAIASLIVSAAAWAMPAVGDQATYAATYTSAAVTEQYTVDRLISSKDATTGFFNIDTTYTQNGTSQVQTEQVDPQDMVTDAQVEGALQNCAMFGGTSETITVAAGTFATCAIPQNGGTVWVAAGVPFAMVKSSGPTSDGGTFNAELQSFVNGK